MKDTKSNLGVIVGTIILANILWFATFYLEFSNFWIKITFSALLLAMLVLWILPSAKPRFQLDAGSVIMGIFSAVVLYFIFWVGKEITSSLFPFAENQINGIYRKGAGTSPAIIFPLLLLVTGPCEEIFWRGYLQEKLMSRFGAWQGWLLAGAAYALVHLWSFNFMLIGAAAVAGSFWGLMYWRYRNIAPAIVSHSVWSSFIFAVVPLS